MSESIRSRLMRLSLNFYPALRGTGGRVTYLAADLRELHVKVPLNWRTRNYVGTIFGGSIYGAVDPFYMLMFMQALGPEYIVWDKAAGIQFKRPGRSTLRATLKIEDEEIESVRAELEQEGKIERTYTIELVDEAGEVCALIEKLIYFRVKENAG
ncbi:MAG: DUF4442 domain-containing protein [Anaerolineae bacterium]|nr:DUF4442 domain-containing protein [Anaerolineae bacterium]